jgi:hypothetical protein
MTIQELTNAIFYLAPDAQFSFTETDLSTLVWHSEDVKRPTNAQILAAIPLANAAMTAAAESKASAKAALLDRLGMSADEAALLLG